MGNCVSWDQRKSIWALRILSEVFLCTGIVACVAAFTIEQGKPNIYFLVSGFCLFLFAAIGLASSFCLSYDGKETDKHPVHTVTLPSAAGSIAPDTSIISAILASKAESGGLNHNLMFNSMKSIPVDSVHSEDTDKNMTFFLCLVLFSYWSSCSVDTLWLSGLHISINSLQQFPDG